MDGSLFEGIEDSDFVSEIFEVSKVGGPAFRMSLEIEDLVDESAEVMQRTYRRKREIVRIAIQAADGAKNESVFDDVERDVALVKSCGQ